VDNRLIIVDQVVQKNYVIDSVAVADVTMKVMIYDTKTGVWSEGQPSPEYTCNNIGLLRPVAAGTTTGVYAPKKIYVLFGSPSDYIYAPVENTWSTIASPENLLFTGCGIAVVDDILYVIGVTDVTTTSQGSAGTMQYVPLGHKDAVPAPESSTTPEPSNTTTTSPATTKPSNSPNINTSKPTITYIIIVALALTIGIVVIGYFYISKKKNRV
jgi:hypothetical protein